MAELLFAYGTLVLTRIQREIIGRTVAMEPDMLDGYRRDRMRLGESIYYVAVKDDAESMHGMVLTIDADDLPRLDAYETSAYQRVRVTLRSGRSAWVYCLPEKT